MSSEEWYKAVSKPGALLIALGAVTCQFHREIAPYRRFEIWTRLLTWDRKWLYLVSHFVEAGTFKPTSYGLQPWKQTHKRIETLSEEDKQKFKKKVFASSVAKYVVKKGRITVPPEMVLERSQMLPPRPEGTPLLGGWQPSEPSKPDSPHHSGSLTPEAGETAAGGSLDESPSHRVLEESLFPASSDADEWTWEKVQEIRSRGLELAAAFDSLDQLKDVFDVEGGEAMGRYTDLVFNF